MGLLVDSVIPEAARDQLLELAVILAAIGITTTFFEVVRSLSVLRVEANERGGATGDVGSAARAGVLPAVSPRRPGAAGRRDRRDAPYVGPISSIVTRASSRRFCLRSSSTKQGFALVGTGVIAVAMAVSMLTAYLKLRIYRSVMELEGSTSPGSCCSC